MTAQERFPKLADIPYKHIDHSYLQLRILDKDDDRTVRRKHASMLQFARKHCPEAVDTMFKKELDYLSLPVTSTKRIALEHDVFEQLEKLEESKAFMKANSSLNVFEKGQQLQQWKFEPAKPQHFDSIHLNSEVACRAQNHMSVEQFKKSQMLQRALLLHKQDGKEKAFWAGEPYEPIWDTDGSKSWRTTTPAVRQVQVVQQALGLDSLPETFSGLKPFLDLVNGNKMYSSARTASALASIFRHQSVLQLQVIDQLFRIAQFESPVLGDNFKNLQQLKSQLFAIVQQSWLQVQNLTCADTQKNIKRFELEWYDYVNTFPVKKKPKHSVTSVKRKPAFSDVVPIHPYNVLKGIRTTQNNNNRGGGRGRGRGRGNNRGGRPTQERKPKNNNEVKCAICKGNHLTHNHERHFRRMEKQKTKAKKT